MPSKKRSRSPEPDAPADGLTEFEAERQARISDNKRRLAELMAGQDFSLLQKQPAAARPRRPVMTAKRRADAQLEPQRRSSRIHNLPTPIYEVDIPDRRTPKRQKVAAGRSRSRADQGEGGGGRSAVGTQRALGGAFLLVVNYRGWEPACGEASGTAAAVARAAALRKVEELEEEGAAAFLKDMTISQVAGGFWCQAPNALAEHWSNITIKCDVMVTCDEETYPLHTFHYNLEEGGRTWKMVWLPRPHSGAGFSGGWRAFAIDQRLHPNDTVVFEVIQQGKLRAHLFRAMDYETDETRAAALAPAAWYTRALQEYIAGEEFTPMDCEVVEEDEAQQEEEEEEEEEEELPQSSEGSKDVEGCGGGRDQQQQQQQAKGKALAAPAAGTRGGSRPGTGGRSSSRNKVVLPTGTDAGGMAPSTPGGCDAGAAEGDQGRKRRPASRTAAAAGAGTAGGVGPGAIGAALGAAADEEEASDEGSGTEQQVNGAAAGTAPAAAARPSAAPHTAKGAAGRKQGLSTKKARVAAAGGASGSSGSRRKAGGRAAAVSSMGPSTPPPRSGVGSARAGAVEAAGPSQEVAVEGEGEAERDVYYHLALQRSKELGLPPPTEEERRAAASAGEFHVLEITDFKMVGSQRQYLVRWWGFGPAWDLWSVEEDLEGPPRTYHWTCPIPAQVPGAPITQASGNRVRPAPPRA